MGTESRNHNPGMNTLVLDMVDNQLQYEDPPAASAAYNRLRKAGYTQQQAREKIASVLSGYVRAVLVEEKTMDIAGYEADLRSLI